jgi:transposase
LEEEIEPRLREAREGKRIVFFSDAAHFVWGAFIGFLWCLTRIFIPTPSGRSRYNVLGAINAINNDLITVCNTTYINALSVCELLEKISERCKNVSIPNTVILDNAKYQKCQLVKELADKLKIELLFLPSYSPNLNLILRLRSVTIERLWKFIKKDCLYCEYYDSFSKFIAAINGCLDNIKNKKDEAELKALLNLKFQLFDNVIYSRT